MDTKQELSKGKRFLQIDRLDPLRAVHGGLISAKLLCLVRTVLCLYYLSVLIVYVINRPIYPLANVIFLTQLTFYGITAYIIVSTYLSWRYLLDPLGYVPWGEYHWIFKFLYFLHYEINILVSMVVTIVYWTLLARPDLATQSSSTYIFTTTSMHAINSVIMLSEAILGHTPLLLSHLPIAQLILYLYLPFAFLIHAIYGIWIYPFLNYIDHPAVTGIVIAGLVFGGNIYYLLMWGLHRLRDRYIEKKSSRSMENSHFGVMDMY